ncbi:DUF6447 family protein [Prochlorococcus marinus]|uniref:Uncharacterized protein n=1 Tax=Prochlorococcus marinus str. PAC1 TaxID=59924 RepID=A0A0A2C7E4_PROMR|nr:DUF6447 family protein [Prochlorococcus marinus]KGG20529.1 hypothetical protein EV03_1030 [Prochlorococcus marinus str. PAC1]
MIKFPWQSSKENEDNKEKIELKINVLNKNNNKTELLNQIHSENSTDQVIENINQTYKYSDLPLELREIVDQIKVADLQIQLKRDTLNMIRPSREKIYLDLKEKLKNIPEFIIE